MLTQFLELLVNKTNFKKPKMAREKTSSSSSLSSSSSSSLSSSSSSSSSSTSSSSSSSPPPSLYSTIIASSIAAVHGKIWTHPLDTVKAKLQIHVTKGGVADPKINVRSLLQLGPRALYQGFPVAVLGSLPAGAAYMSMYNF